jgi:hypothetical protein
MYKLQYSSQYVSPWARVLRFFLSNISRTILDPIQPPAQCVLDILPLEIKQIGHDAYNSPPVRVYSINE